MIKRVWLLLLAALWFTSLYATACRPMEPRGSIEAKQVDQKVAIGFAAARTALALLDAAEVIYLDEGTRAHKFRGEDDPALLASGKRIETLKKIRTALELVRQRLAGEVKTDLAQVLTDLKSALAAARDAGVKVPSEVGAVLSTLQELS